MYDDFFFPYEKAKLWTGNMVLLSLSNFLLYASLYMMLPALPLWMVRHWYCSYAEAGAAVAVFGLAMFLPGAFNSYLIDTFKRKSVCLVAMLLFVASSLLYPYVATVGFIALVRAVQGGLFSVITMTTGSTPHGCEYRLFVGGAFWNGGRSCVGNLHLSLLEFSPCCLYLCRFGHTGFASDSGGGCPFPCSAAHLMVLVGPFSVASYSVAGTEYDDAFRRFRHFDSTHLQ